MGSEPVASQEEQLQLLFSFVFSASSLEMGWKKGICNSALQNAPVIFKNMGSPGVYLSDLFQKQDWFKWLYRIVLQTNSVQER